MIKENKRIVGQSNEFIRDVIYGDLTMNDLKVFKAIVSKINYRESLFEDFYSLNYRELDLAGIGRGNRFERVTEILKKLANTYVRVPLENGKTRAIGLIMNDFIYDERTKYIEVKVNEMLKSNFLELKNYYTRYELNNISKFKTVQTLKIYELMKSWQRDNGKDFIITVLNFRKFLEIKKDEYPRYANFKQRYINKAINEINKYSDIDLVLKEIKKGTKVDTLIFVISSDTDIKNAEIKQSNYDLKNLVNIPKADNSYVVVNAPTDDEINFALNIIGLSSAEAVGLYENFIEWAKDKSGKKCFRTYLNIGVERGWIHP
jgi:hypothetical protein